MTWEKVTEVLAVVWPYVLMVLPFVLGLVSLYLKGELENKSREAVSAVYRIAIHAADGLQDEGLAWVRSPEGIAYRKELAAYLYDLLPAKIGGVPVGLIKAFVTRERWEALVESAFQEAVKLADRVELPKEAPIQ